MPKINAVRFHAFGGVDVLRWESVDLSMPDAGELLIAVHVASINPVDFKIRSGKYPAVKEDKLPYTPGRDVSGIVEKCGAGALRRKVGEEIFGMVGVHGGGYAQKAILSETALARKPKTLDHIHAASVPLAGQTAWQGLFRYGEVKPGQRILIHGGSGGVGHFAVQFAKAKGTHVTTTVSTAHATRYTVQADGNELAQIADLIDAGKVQPRVAKTFPLSLAAQALEAVEVGHPEGKIVLTVD
jgi:NADPH:quinone reductase-like Zn-dependent oxidoreductase